jgi:NADH-quinone oxidoreductase subunit F
MLHDKDRILRTSMAIRILPEAARSVDKTAALMKVGQDAIIEEVKASGLRGRGRQVRRG